MERIIYISRFMDTNLAARIHRAAIQEIFGEENVFVIELSESQEPCVKKNYIAYGRYTSITDRILRMLQGNIVNISNHIIKEICKIILEKKIDTVFIDDSVLGNLVKTIKIKFPNVKVVTFYMDIKADLYRKWLVEMKTSIARKIDMRLGLRQEKINQRYSDIDIVFNERESRLYTQIYGGKATHILPLASYEPHGLMPSITNKDSSKVILFVGTKYYPNVDGLRWFYNSVIENLNEKFTLKIVGRGLEFLRNEFTDNRVNVIGGVETLDSYYREADVIIIPIFKGGGMKSKTIEALSYGKIIIGTRESLVGVWDELGSNIQNNKVYCSDSSKEWIDILNKLLNQDLNKFEEEVFAVFKDKFSYESVREKMRDLLLR